MRPKIAAIEIPATAEPVSIGLNKVIKEKIKKVKTENKMSEQYALWLRADSGYWLWNKYIPRNPRKVITNNSMNQVFIFW